MNGILEKCWTRDSTECCRFEWLQYKAVILILATLVYFVEYAVTPRMMAAMTPVSECAAHSSGGDCCHGAVKGRCPKPTKGCNPTSDCCLNCPLCFVMLLPAGVERGEAATVSLEYPEWASSYLYLYHASCWKPPNAA